MNIGLSYMTQIRGGDDTGQRIGTAKDDETTKDQPTTPKSLGGWIALTFNQLVASVASGYHTEHNSNDSHGTIHATGSIAERGRLVPMGAWIDAGTVDATAFTADSGVTFSVPLAGQHVSYMLIGTTMFLNIRLNTCTISAAASPFLHLRIPGGYTAVSEKGSACVLYDNTAATGVLGLVRVLTNARVIDFVRFDGANFLASVANTFINAQFYFEVA